MLQPIDVRIQIKKRDGVKHRLYHLVAGYRRLKALRNLRRRDPETFASVPAVIFEGNEIEAALANLAENIDRKDLNIAHVAERIVELQRQGVNMRRIAERINKHQRYLYNLAAIHKDADPGVRELLAKAQITVNEASQLKQLDRSSQRTAVEKIKQAPTKQSKKAAISEATGKPVKPVRSRTEILAFRDKLKTDKRQVADTVRKVLEWVVQARSYPPEL